jgi:hypothetical protein
LVAGYADELARGGSMAARSETAAVGRLLASHAGPLRTVTRSLSEDPMPRPAFPPRTGVADTFGFFGHFLPVAMIVAVVELIFPLTLWLYTFFALQAQLAREEPHHRPEQDEPEHRPSLRNLRR